MTFDQLRYFVAVARQGHMGHAARELHLSTSAVSHSLAALEKDLGVALFNRVGRTLTLTAQGELFQQRCEDILGRFGELGQGLSEGEVVPQVRAGGPPSLVNVALAPAVSKCAQRFPRLEAALSFVPSGEVEQRLRDGDLNVGLMYLEVKPPRTAHVIIAPAALFYCVRSDHPLFKLAPAQRVKQLTRYPMVSPQPREALLKGTDPAIKALIKSGVVVQYLIPSYDVGARILAETDAWGIFPGWAVAAYGRSLARLMPKSVCNGASIACLYRDELEGSAVLTELLSHLRATFSRPD